jgi:quercetin dioxygenase-like cupin family protein
MRNPVQFAGESFSDELPTRHGNIPFTANCYDKTGMKVRAGMKKGCSYPRGCQPFRSTIQIVNGSGRFFLGGQEYAYGPGRSFVVGAHVLHCFIWVDEDTIFIQDVPDMTPA